MRALASRERGLPNPSPGMHVLSGLVAGIASTLCWLYILRVASLSRACGLTSLTCVFITLASVYLFGEQIRRPHVVRTVLIVIGIACLVSGD